MLLRCVDAGRYALAEGPPLSAVELASRMRGKLPASALSADLQLALPAARCLVTTVPVAKHEARLLAKTLPWTLEERLLEPAEQLHCAHGAVTNGSAPVAALNAAWLRQVLADLAAAGVKPLSASSELVLLPWQPGQWTVFLPAGEAPVLVRHGAHAGFACARANLQTALQLLLNESGEAPRHFAVYAEPAAGVDTSVLFPVLLQSRLTLQRQGWWQLAKAAAPSACNLLQGRFAPPLPWAQWWRQWRLAAALLAALLVTDLALSGHDSFRLNRAAARNEAELVTLYRSVQPDGIVVDPRVQLEQALAALGGGAQPGFLTLLSRMAPALQAAPDAVVQNLEYDSASGELQLQILTADYAAAENLRGKLLQLGLQAELLGSSRDGAGSRTRLRVGA